jgi:phosphatidyl-myo-inositol alpha-mannosyltransferase
MEPESVMRGAAGLRVLLVCPYSWSTPVGVQTQVAGLARELRRRGADVDVLAPADGPVALDGFVPVGSSIPFAWQGTVTRVALSPLAVARTARQVRRGGYDVVHVHEPMLPAAGLTAVVAARAPVVATFHMTADSVLWYRLFAPVVRAAARRIDMRLAVSEEAAAFARRALGGGEYRIVPNAIAVPEEEPPVRNGGRRVLFVGRPDPRKGLPVLLRALDRLPDVTLDLVGVEAVPHERARAHGFVGEEERARLVAEADVLCAPSLGRESFGVVLLEAMAAGLPVVATDIPGYAAVVPPEAGRLVPPGDAGALADTLRELLDDPALRARMGAAGRRAARAYDWRAVGDRIVEIYAEVL